MSDRNIGHSDWILKSLYDVVEFFVDGETSKKSVLRKSKYTFCAKFILFPPKTVTITRELRKYRWVRLIIDERK